MVVGFGRKWLWCILEYWYFLWTCLERLKKT